MECGARRGPLPRAIAKQLAVLLRRGRDRATGTEGAKAEEESKPDETEERGLAAFAPNPRAAAVAVMGMLAFGVMLGSAISPLARSAGITSILLEAAPPGPEPSEAPEAARVEPEPEAEAEAPLAETSAVPLPEVPEEAPELPKEPIEEPLPEFPDVEELPEVKHLFLIVLGENGYEETFGAASPSPYLSRRLPKQGELLPNYFAVAPSDLANQVALLSGQGPTAETAANCPNYGDVMPGTETADKQVEGNGCVYPASAETLPGQLTAAGLRWMAYVEDVGNAPEQPTSCRHPALGTPDPARAAVPGDAYATWRNPFVYFHSLIDGTECAERDVGFDRLASDLKRKGSKFPTLAYIVPNLCHAGGPVPCEAGQPAGAEASAELLKTLVPRIMLSDAYRENGLIAITSSLAPQSGEHADASTCCAVPAYPNLPPPPPAPPVEAPSGPVKSGGGGGRVGMLLISPFVEPGSVDEAGYYNHFGFLRTVEELLGLPPLGYAGDPASTAFEPSVFNAAPEAPEEEAPEPASRAGSAARSAAPEPLRRR